MQGKSKVILGVVAAVIILMCARSFSGGGEIQTLSVSGSTTVLPIIQKAADYYMDNHSTVDILISGGGSSVGIQSVGEGTADIGMASRDIKDSERDAYPTLKPIAIAKDGIAIAVHPSNVVTSLSVEEIRKIYEGTYTNWSQLGGSTTDIVVIGRDSASGTREFFWQYVMKKKEFVTTLLEKNSNGAIKQTVAQTPGAIGYIGLSYIDDTIKIVKVKVDTGDVEPTVEAIQNGSYPLSRDLYLIVAGEPEGLVKKFIDFILSSEGQKLVEEEGFIPIHTTMTGETLSLENVERKELIQWRTYPRS